MIKKGRMERGQRILFFFEIPLYSFILSPVYLCASAVSFPSSAALVLDNVERAVLLSDVADEKE
jgi:hypothetical protein